MLKKLILKNFQKHKYLEIEFVQGVNVLYGHSDAGKSCIRRAIEWIVQNENIDGIRKTGTKKTSVSITLNNNIEVERIRAQSINRYIIRKGKDEQIFDSVGKSIPEEVKEVFGIYPIKVDGEEIYLNSQPQIGLPFLFDKSPSFRMKLFNKLTGNDVLDKLFGEFNKDILRIKRNKKEEEERLDERETHLKNKKTEMEKAVAIHTRLKNRIEKLKVKYKKYSKLLELKELIESNFKDQKNISKTLKSFNFPQPSVLQQLRKKIDRFHELSTHKNACEKVDYSLNRVREQLKDLKPLKVDLSDLRGKIDRLSKIEPIYEKLSQNQGLLSSIKKELKILDKDIHHGKKEYKDLLKECKICPICQNEVTEEHLKDIKL